MEDTELKKMKEQSQKLVGKTVVLAPRNSFFTDADRQYTLCGVGDKGNDRAVIAKDWKLYSTMLGIRHGLLRVLNDHGKDITSQFGGQASPETAPQAPIVTDVPKTFDPEEKLDKELSRILSITVESEVLKAIASRNYPYDVLERLLELEKAGENQTSAPRQKIVDGIVTLMDNTPGIGRVGKKEDEAVITTRKA